MSVNVNVSRHHGEINVLCQVFIKFTACCLPLPHPLQLQMHSHSSEFTHTARERERQEREEGEREEERAHSTVACAIRVKGLCSQRPAWVPHVMSDLSTISR